MGAIVTTTARSVPVGVSKFLVIDGQQRLTTIAALLCAIRDQLSETDSVRRRIQESYLTNASYSGLDLFKLLPTQDDRPSYARLIEGLDVRGLDSPFIKAYEFFCKRLKKSGTEGGPTSPLEVLDVVERRLMVVSINLGENDDPNLIFESLNFKGAPLNQADLIRNYFMMKFPASEQDTVYNRSWLPMQKRLGDSLTDFFRHYLGSVGNDVRKTDVYAAVKHLVKEEDTAAVRVRIARLARLADLYSRITTLFPDPDPGLGRYFQTFRRLDFGTVLPLILKLYERYEECIFTQPEFVGCLRVLDSYLIRRAVLGVASNSLAGLFISLCRTLPADFPTAWLSDSLARETKTRRWPSDPEFCQDGLRRELYPGVVCQMVLERLEEQIPHRERASLSSVSVEHILPQTMSIGWKQSLGENAAAIHSQWLHTLGNLTLTGYNSELGNREFSEKRKLLAESHFELNRYFVGCQSWGADEIERRGRSLLERALALWPRPVSETEEAPVSPKHKRAKPGAFHMESVSAVERHLKTSFSNLSRNQYQGGNGGCLVGAFSEEHIKDEHNSSYWFSIGQDGLELLYEAGLAWFCLECGSPRQILLIPTQAVRPIQSQMSTSRAGRLHFDIQRRGRRFWLRLLGGVDGPELTPFLVVSPQDEVANG